MEGPIVGVYGIVFMFLVLFLLRIPVGFTMALVGFLGFAFVTSFKAALGAMEGPPGCPRYHHPVSNHHGGPVHRRGNRHRGCGSERAVGLIKCLVK